MHKNQSAGVSGEDFRKAMSAVCAPVSVITTVDEGRPHGSTVSAFMSLSLTPPAVLISLDNNSTLLSIVRRTGRVGLNVLTASQNGLAGHFASKGDDKFEHIDHEICGDMPRLPGTALWASARVTNIVDAYDHSLLYCVLDEVDVIDQDPLLYHQHGFTRPVARVTTPVAALASAERATA